MAELDLIVASATIWTVVGIGIGLSAGLIALLTALIEHRTVRSDPRPMISAPEAAHASPQRKVLLPARAYFVDRETEMQDALERIRAGEIVLTIEGALGVGKSAAAVELAHRLNSVRDVPGALPQVPDNTFLWIDAQNSCPRLADICRDLSLLTEDQSLSAVGDDEKLAALRTHLAGNRTVLLLDNLRPATGDESRELEKFVRAVPAGSLVIASVNRPGAVVGSRVVLNELELPYVVELIKNQVRRLGLADVETFDATFAQRLMGVVGGNPRMIEWFLRAYSRGTKSLEEHLAALSRGEGLEAVFAPMWLELAEASRLVLAACATLGGQATDDQLRISCQLDDETLVSALEELLGLGLLTAVRVTGQPAVHSCAHGLQRFVLAETPPAVVADLSQRLTHHYIERFGKNWEDARDAIPHVGAVRALVQKLYGDEDDAGLQALFGATLDIFFTLGLFDDRITIGTLAYKSAVRAHNDRGASLASSVLSSTHAIRNESQLAREALAHGLLAAERAGDPREIARQMRCVGFVAYRSGQAAEALEAVAGADELACEAGDLNTLVDILGLRTAAHWYLGSAQAAEEAAQQCLSTTCPNLARRPATSSSAPSKSVSAAPTARSRRDSSGALRTASRTWSSVTSCSPRC